MAHLIGSEADNLEIFWEETLFLLGLVRTWHVAITVSALQGHRDQGTGAKLALFQLTG